MDQIKQANDGLRNQAAQIQSREMLVGWMTMLAGDTRNKAPAGWNNSIEDIDQDGVLRVTIEGQSGRPTKIVDARADGLNPTLRASMKGMKLGSMRKGGQVDGQERSNGIDLLVTTALHKFKVTPATWTRMEQAGKAPTSEAIRSKANQAIWFSLFAERTGSVYWQDTDMAWGHDFNWGADAGRWFLDNVRNGGLIVADLDAMTLPTVNT